ncbi:hypothetical protein [Acinetobacter tianfuensis]|uniref:Uncharacterized protein n=1 Tax=Acinetobacter tianfuensis TaxID=2419603 RepID=A0A3A8E4I0_9GAMM|nr:hypothetical protein [Acinetobacter tianfuensis]RKG29059.1 hypothetical protein D7V32_16720 [Acinetobacter tianfuensis]
MPEHENKQSTGFKKTVENLGKTLVAVGVTTGTMALAHAEEASSGISIDLTTGAVATVTVVAGLMAAGSLKALPTYAAWGIRKALSMLR